MPIRRRYSNRLAAMDRMVGLRNISDSQRTLNVVPTPDGGVILTFAPVEERSQTSGQNPAAAGTTVYSEGDVRRLISQFTEMQQALVRQSQQFLDSAVRTRPPTTPNEDRSAPAAKDELPSWLTHRISELEDRRSVWNRLWDMVLGNR